MDLLLQFQAGITDTVVVRSASAETTAQGAAYLAGLAAGVWKNRQEFFESWQAGAQFKPRMRHGSVKLCMEVGARRFCAPWTGLDRRLKIEE